MTITTIPVSSAMYGDWRAAERALVVVGHPAVGTGVVVTGGIIVTTARAALRAAGGADPSRLTVRVLAADDHRWRGAEAGVLSCDIVGDGAVLGAAPWVEHDGLDALADLIGERQAVGVQQLEIDETVTLHVPTPGGAWIRVPGVVASDLDVVVTAASINSDAAIAISNWAGTPVFSETGMLVGFLARSTGTSTVVRRVDHIVGARLRHARRGHS